MVFIHVSLCLKVDKGSTTFVKTTKTRFHKLYQTTIPHNQDNSFSFFLLVRRFTPHCFPFVPPPTIPTVRLTVSKEVHGVHCEVSMYGPITKDTNILFLTRPVGSLKLEQGLHWAVNVSCFKLLVAGLVLRVTTVIQSFHTHSQTLLPTWTDVHLQCQSVNLVRVEGTVL